MTGIPTKATGKKITQFRLITDAALNNDALSWVVGDDKGILYQPTIKQMRTLLGVAGYSGDLQTVLTAGSSLTKDNTITLNGFKLVVSGGAFALTGALTDGIGVNGTAGQILSSTGSQVKWINPPAGGGSGWGLTGNASTDPATNFIGTTDNKDLFFRANNVPTVRMDTLGRLDILGSEVLMQGARFIFADSNSNLSIGSSSFTPASSAGGGSIAIGKNALAATYVGGGWNLAVGDSALMAINNGSANIAIGGSTLKAMITGSFTTAVGWGALAAFTPGAGTTWNTAIGGSSQNKNTTGTRNTSVGMNSMYANITGSYNTVMGSTAMDSCTSGSENTVMGQNALHFLATGNNNVAIGKSAGYTLNGNNNVVVGWQSCYNGWGSNNTIIGASAGAILGASADNNIAIGYNANLVANTSNQMNIGNKFVTSSDGTKLGVYKTGALAVLDINGDVAISNLAAGVSGTDNPLVADANGIIKKIPAGTIGYVIQATQTQIAAPADGELDYFAGQPNSNTTINARIYIPQTGIITKAVAFFTNGTVGSNEASSIYVDVNGTSTLIGAVDNSLGSQVISSTTLNIPVNGNFVDYVRGKWQAPTWVTNPANVRVSFVFWIKT